MKIKNKISPFIELTRGLISYLPGFNHPIFTKTGGTSSARYCYSVWLRHLAMAEEYRSLEQMPKIVAELGPGDSLGMGLCALLSGVEKYYAFDVVKYANSPKNLEIFEELVNLFKNKRPIPDDKEFPLVKPYLDNHSFPDKILTDDLLKAALKEERLNMILDSIKNPESKDSVITYQVPWNDSSVIQKNSVDMIFSQATLEHIDKIEEAYKTMFDWLRLDGFMSHQIDLKCHGMSSNWNGHWTYSDLKWKLFRGKREWLLNRLACSDHLKIITTCGFKIIQTVKIEQQNHLKKSRIAKKFKHLTDKDLETSGIFILAKKLN